MTPDPLVELHALAVLDVLEEAQRLVDEWQKLRYTLADTMLRLEDALSRLDRVEVVTEAAA